VQSFRSGHRSHPLKLYKNKKQKARQTWRASRLLGGCGRGCVISPLGLPDLPLECLTTPQDEKGCSYETRAYPDYQWHFVGEREKAHGPNQERTKGSDQDDT